MNFLRMFINILIKILINYFSSVHGNYNKICEKISKIQYNES